MKMNKAVIFDWSGTLSDSFDSFFKVCELIFTKRGKKPLSKEEIRLSYTLPYMRFWNKYFPELSRKEQEALFSKYAPGVWHTELFPNAAVVVKHLHKMDFKLFVLSSDLLSTLLPEIEKAGLSKYFTKVFGEIHEKKYVIAQIVKDYGLDRTYTFYVGDSSGDIEAGKFAQVKTIGISWGFQHKDILAKANPDFIIDNITEIINILKL